MLPEMSEVCIRRQFGEEEVGYGIGSGFACKGQSLDA